MGRESHTKYKIAGILYSKPAIDKTALTLKKSLDEVKGILDNPKKKKK